MGHLLLRGLLLALALFSLHLQERIDDQGFGPGRKVTEVASLLLAFAVVIKTPDTKMTGYTWGRAV